MSDVHICGKLNKEQSEEIAQLLHEFADVMTDKPGCTNLVEHDIKLTSNNPVRLKPYPLPYSMTETVNREVDDMLHLDIIESSDSAYSSPIVLVKKREKNNSVLHRLPSN